MRTLTSTLTPTLTLPSPCRGFLGLRRLAGSAAPHHQRVPEPGVQPCRGQRHHDFTTASFNLLSRTEIVKCQTSQKGLRAAEAPRRVVLRTCLSLCRSFVRPCCGLRRCCPHKLSVREGLHLSLRLKLPWLESCGRRRLVEITSVQRHLQEVTASPMSADYAPRSRTHPPPARSPEPQLAPEPNIRSAGTYPCETDVIITYSERSNSVALCLWCVSCSAPAGKWVFAAKDMQWEGRKGCVLHNKVTSRHLPRRAVGDLFAPVAAAAGCPSQTLVLNKPWPTLPAWMHQRTYLTGEFLMQVRAAPLIRHVQATALLHAWQLSLASVEHAALATLHRGSHATRRSLKCPALHLLPFAERF